MPIAADILAGLILRARKEGVCPKVTAVGHQGLLFGGDPEQMLNIGFGDDLIEMVPESVYEAAKGIANGE